ncbi:hypothetical protein AAG906_011708 [Vitis piasezkii]
MGALTTVVFIFSYVFSLLRISTAVDTITINQHIRAGETITSAGGTFELGFFSPGNSKNRYLGICSSRSAQDPNAQLLESGNLVMRNGNDGYPENFLWQSFDYPCDTLLPGMKLGRNRVTGLDRYLSSWKSADDPSKGNFTYGIDLSGFPQLLLRNGLAVEFRAGPWDVNSSVIMRLVLTPDGKAQRFTYTDQKNEWTPYSTAQRDDCDDYAICGVYGICKIDESPKCECMKGFRPKFQSNWDMADWSNGCIRSTPLDCQKGDGFVKYSGVKLPDTRNSWFNESMNLKECASLCMRNCSCTAYANSDIRGGGSGCLLWFGDLIDIRDFTQNGQEFYVRMAASELGYMDHNSRDENNEGQAHLELPLFDLDTLLNATNNFSSYNKLGEGGFGPVYKNVMFSGNIARGQEIAVKMMSKTSRQGLKDVVLDWPKRFLIINGIARGLLYLHQDSRLRIIHRDLKAGNILLDEEMTPKISDFGMARSFRGNETEANTKRVVGTYGYMSPEYAIDGLYSTKSDVFSFGVLVLEIVSMDIVHGRRSMELIETSVGDMHDLSQVLRSINVGLLCPGFSLEGSEVLLKKSGLSSSNGVTITMIVFHKIDVFSFGVLVLEIVSGKRNRGFNHPDHDLSLLGHAWTLFMEDRSSEFIDASMGNSCILSEVLRSEGALPRPNEPCFFIDRNMMEANSSFVHQLFIDDEGYDTYWYNREIGVVETNSIHSQVQSIHVEGPNVELLEFENLVMKIGDDRIAQVWHFALTLDLR